MNRSTVPPTISPTRAGRAFLRALSCVPTSYLEDPARIGQALMEELAKRGLRIAHDDAIPAALDNDSTWELPLPDFLRSQAG